MAALNDVDYRSAEANANYAGQFSLRVSGWRKSLVAWFSFCPLGVFHVFMKYHTLLLGAVLLAVSSFGCSKHSSAVAGPKSTDWGVVEVTDDVSSSHTLADGRVCTLTPKILPGGHQVQVEMSITNFQAGEVRYVHSLTSFFNPDQTTTFSFDPSNLVTLTLHISQ
jgi:hypothetical protein